MQNKTPLSTHSASLFPYPDQDGKLLIAGKSIATLIHIIGQTPAYIYDRQHISQTINSLCALLPEQVQLHYALKANPMPAVVQHIAHYVSGLDIASHGELLIALNSGVSPENISFAGPGKTEHELIAAISSGVCLNVESENELRHIDQLGKQLNTLPTIALRVNPDFELKASGMKMSGGAKQFGIDAEKIPTIIQSLAQCQLNFAGLHIFCGSQNLNSNAIIDAHKQIFALAAQLLNGIDDYQSINIGGGFGIPYFAGDKALNVEAITHNLHELLKQYPQFQQKKITLELGRYLVGEAGIYISQVIDKKESRGKTYLVCDGGLHHHLPNSGNFGQVIRKNYPVCISKKLTNNVLNHTEEREMEYVTIVGPSCTPLDTLADNMLLTKADVGDYVVILQSGAYGRTASPENFLGHPHVKEMLV
jgi:diaminopimelate decarboxylase